MKRVAAVTSASRGGPLPAEPHATARASRSARDVLLEQQPDVYYITSHHRGYASVLVRLARVGRSELRNLREQAVQFVGTRQTKNTATKAANEPAKAIVQKTAKLAAQRKSRRS